MSARESGSLESGELCRSDLLAVAVSPHSPGDGVQGWVHTHRMRTGDRVVQGAAEAGMRQMGEQAGAHEGEQGARDMKMRRAELEVRQAELEVRRAELGARKIQLEVAQNGDREAAELGRTQAREHLGPQAQDLLGGVEEGLSEGGVKTLDDDDNVIINVEEEGDGLSEGGMKMQDAEDAEEERDGLSEGGVRTQDDEDTEGEEKGLSEGGAKTPDEGIEEEGDGLSETGVNTQDDEDAEEEDMEVSWQDAGCWEEEELQADDMGDEGLDAAIMEGWDMPFSPKVAQEEGRLADSEKEDAQPSSSTTSDMLSPGSKGEGEKEPPARASAFTNGLGKPFRKSGHGPLRLSCLQAWLTAAAPPAHEDTGEEHEEAGDQQCNEEMTGEGTPVVKIRYPSTVLDASQSPPLPPFADNIVHHHHHQQQQATFQSPASAAQPQPDPQVPGPAEPLPVPAAQQQAVMLLPATPADAAAAPPPAAAPSAAPAAAATSGTEGKPCSLEVKKRKSEEAKASMSVQGDATPSKEKVLLSKEIQRPAIKKAKIGNGEGSSRVCAIQ